MALGRVFVALRFACPTSWWASCFINYNELLSYKIGTHVMYK